MKIISTKIIEINKNIRRKRLLKQVANYDMMLIMILFMIKAKTA